MFITIINFIIIRIIIVGYHQYNHCRSEKTWLFNNSGNENDIQSYNPNQSQYVSYFYDAIPSRVCWFTNRISQFTRHVVGMVHGGWWTLIRLIVTKKNSRATSTTTTNSTQLESKIITLKICCDWIEVYELNTLSMAQSCSAWHFFTTY